MSTEVRFYHERNNLAQVNFRIFDSSGDLVDTLVGAQNANNVWEADFSSIAPTPAADYYDVVAIAGLRTLGKERIYWNGTALLDVTVQGSKEVRTELSTELAYLMSLENGLTTDQNLWLLEIYRLLGLDPTRPLVVTKTERTVLPEIEQTLADTGTQTTVQRI